MTWEFTKSMIAMQDGDLSNLNIFGLNMTGYSAYLNNIYMTGTIEQLQDGKIKRFVSDKSNINSLPSNTVLSLAVDEHNRLWIGTTKGLCFWDGKDFKSMQVGEIFTGFIMQLLADRDGSLWVGTNKGLVHLSDIGSPIGQIFLAGKRITALWQDHHGALWISDGPNVFLSGMTGIYQLTCPTTKRQQKYMEYLRIMKKVFGFLPQIEAIEIVSWMA